MRMQERELSLEDGRDFPADIPCQLGGDMKPFLRFPRVWTQESGRPFRMYWSDNWQHGLLYPTPTDEELRAFYSTEQYDEYMQAGPGSHRNASRDFLDRLIDPVLYRAVALFGEGDKLDADFVRRRVAPPASILDIGCGPGVMLAELRDHGYEVAGIDPNPVALASARERGIRMFAGTGENMPDDVPNEHYDMVTMSQSLEHTRDPALALGNAASRLKKGGLLVVEVPNCGSAGFQQRRSVWFHTDAGRHINFFTRKSLEAFLHAVGLVPVEHGFSGITHQFARLGDEQECWDALYRANPMPDAPARPDRWSRLSLFLRVLRGPEEARRDMVWMVGRKADHQSPAPRGPA